MFTSVKLKIDIDCTPYTENCQDPKTEVYKILNSIKGLRYTELPYDEPVQNCEENIYDHGQTSLLTPGTFSEWLGTPQDNSNDIINVFKKFLDRIIFTDHLILIDYYIFADLNDNLKYSDFITKIFANHLKKLQKITFVTSKSKYKKATERQIVDNFLAIKRHLKIETKFSDEFHDRFWICGKRGIFVGSSLNGIGKKYCLVDYITPDDVYQINNYLKVEGLVT